MSRGVLYLIWDGERAEDSRAVLQRSLASLRHWHPELPYEVVEMPHGSNLSVKCHMYDKSPFEETLFLDADTAVMGRLDFGFLKAQQHGLACCINASPWQRRYYKLPREHRDAIEYSSGVVFFDKNWQGADGTRVKSIFHNWQVMSADPETYQTPSLYMSTTGPKEMPVNDQALFTRAMERLQFNPCVLPLNWNLYPRWQKHFWGPLRIWHGYDDIPEGVMVWDHEQDKDDAVIQCGGLP